ncbi:MAG TPA: VOC family protein [Caulobacteraceae bacterium]|jgi:catechol 2,3-dioxygenase-like lactoylglutathione lyase family enzyme
MIDHIELRSRDLAQSAAFYAAVLTPLGYAQILDGETKGFSDASGPDFFLVPGEAPDQAHYAFRAPDRATVRACCAVGETLGALQRPPALAPHIHPNYYAGYLTDPDGRLVEFTCHQPA